VVFFLFLRGSWKPPYALLLALAPTPVLPGLLAEPPAKWLAALGVAASCAQLALEGRRRAAAARAL
jgi:hypothetical protein